jgi:hypothetical protein
MLHARIVCAILLSLDKNADAVNLETLLPGFTPPSLAPVEKDLWREQ